jgi:hypothetical protein
VCSAESLGVSVGKRQALTSELDTLGCHQAARKRKEKHKPEAAAPGKSQRGIYLTPVESVKKKRHPSGGCNVHNGALSVALQLPCSCS